MSGTDESGDGRKSRANTDVSESGGVERRLHRPGVLLRELLSLKSRLEKQKSFVEYKDGIEDEDFKQTLKFPASLSESIQHELYQKLGLKIPLISFRVNLIGTRHTRRDSLLPVSKSGRKKTAHSGKRVTTKQKTQLDGYIGHGELPAHADFLTKDRGLDVRDNSDLGTFPIFVSEVSDSMMYALRESESSDILQVRTGASGCLIYYTKWMPQYNKDFTPVINKATGLTQKKARHYRQSADSLYTIFEYIRDGHYILQSNSTIDEFIIKDRLGNIVMFNLAKTFDNEDELAKIDPNLLGDFLKKFKAASTDQSKIKSLASSFIKTNLISGKEVTELGNYHVPIFKRGDIKKDSWVPLMAYCDGGSITSDTDVEHLAIPNHLPSIMHKMFSSFYPGATEKFIVGLKILVARLEAKSSKEFIDLCAKQGFSNDLLREYLCGLEIDHPDCYVVHNNIKLLEATKATLKDVTEDNTLLSKVGLMNIFTLIVFRTLKNPFLQHGSEEFSPLDVPEPFSGILNFRFRKTKKTKATDNAKSTTDAKATTKENAPYKLSQSDDEETYIQYIFSKPRVLLTGSIGVLPYWLRKRDAKDQRLADSWLKVLEVQALVQLRRGIRDARSSKIPKTKFNVFYEDYKIRLADTMIQHRKGGDESYAWEQIEIMFNKIDNQFVADLKNKKDFNVALKSIEKDMEAIFKAISDVREFDADVDLRGIVKKSSNVSDSSATSSRSSRASRRSSNASHNSRRSS